MDEKENTGTESSAVTAIKVKVVIDTNKTELDKQFNSVKEHYKEKPVKIAFGVNQNDTIRNINDALDKVVKSGKLKTPKVTLDVNIDQSKVTAQLKKAMQSAAKQTVKIDTGKSGSTKTDTTGASEIKQLEKFVEQAKAKTIEWKSSIKGTTEEAKKLSSNLQNIVDQINALDKDHTSKGYASGVNGLKTSFNIAKEQVSDYTKEYQKLERQATSTLDNIHKQQTKLKAHGISSFDRQISGYGNDKDGSFEARFRNLDKLNPQSKEYAETLGKILVDWEKVNIQINEAIKAEGNLSVSTTARQKKIEDVADSIQGLRNVAMGSDVAKNKELKKYAFGDTTKNADSGALHDLDVSLKNLKAVQNNPTEFIKQLQALENELGNVSQKLTEYKKKFQESTSTTNESTNLRNLVTTINKYEETLNNLDKRQDLKKRLYDIRDAAEAQSKPFNVLSNEFAELKIDMENAGIAAETLGQKLSRLFKEHFQTAIAMAGVAMVKQGLREVYDNVVEIDDAMVELRKVTNESENAYSQFSDRAAKTARDLGASISDYISATADWSRLGYNMPDAEELARVSTLLKNVGDGIESVTDASSYMTSVLKGFDLVAEDAQKVADLVNEVANNEPASAEDILEILTRSGAALHEAGNDLDQAVALGVAMNSVTQNAESTGQTLKTVSMYLRAAKTDLTAMGESTDGCANSVSELRSELKKLTGVDIMADAAGTQFKSTYDILMEISKVWGKLTDVDRANVTELLGGKRNANSVSAVLSQFQIAEKSMKDAANSAGSAAKENEVYLTSITGKLNQLDSAFQQFSKDLLDSSLIKFFVDFATATVDIADGAVKAAGALPTLTAAISGVLSVMQMSGKLKNGAGKVNMPSYICCV
ncbi:phage tail tape measure protein%2C TP901 family%2C core region [uncultured Faecalibacterium sp.]|nr:phage tail tape measure protein%2C TP901 family%2C core region [uncultured Faecalibacterium sp.]